MSEINKNSLYKASIDSFKYFIPLDSIDVIDNNLYSKLLKITVNTDTGQVIEEQPIQDNSIKAIENKYHVHYAIRNFFGVKHLVILVNSKMLENNYLDGIVFKNSEKIFNKIQSHNIVRFKDFTHFLNGFVSDIDFKKDIEVSTHKDFDLLTLELEKLTKHSTKKYEGANRFSKKTNKGIEFNERTKSTFNKPFLKIYHKGIESINNSNFNFFETYIDLDSIRNRVRIECTVKDKEDLKKYGFNSNTLYDVLNVSNNKYDEIIKDCINKNIDNPTSIKTIKPKTTMTPTEQVHFNSITLLINNNHLTFERVLDLLISNISDKVAKSRTKKQICQVYEQHIKGLKIETKAQKLDKFFRDIDFM
jgi:hypothetical protein